MKTVESLEKEIKKIKDRNKAVEADKAWEISLARKCVVSALTYAFLVIFFYTAGFSRPWINALVPSIAFLLSSASLKFFKKLWLKNK